MLLSPGNSPRHISSEKTLVTAAETTQSSSSNSLPSNSNPRRKRSPEVLDEDTYIAALEQIVERDFFPDLPKLRESLDWLEAIRSGDPVHIEVGAFIRHVTSTGRLSESLLRVPAFTRCNSSEASLQNESTLANDIKEEKGPLFA